MKHAGFPEGPTCPAKAATKPSEWHSEGGSAFDRSNGEPCDWSAFIRSTHLGGVNPAWSPAHACGGGFQETAHEAVIEMSGMVRAVPVMLASRPQALLVHASSRDYPTTWLSGHGGDVIEVLVVVEELRPRDLCRCGDEQVWDLAPSETLLRQLPLDGERSALLRLADDEFVDLSSESEECIVLGTTSCREADLEIGDGCPSDSLGLKNFFDSSAHAWLRQARQHAGVEDDGQRHAPSRSAN